MAIGKNKRLTKCVAASSEANEDCSEGPLPRLASYVEAVSYTHLTLPTKA